MDRAYALYKPSGSPLAGTGVAFILTYGDDTAESSGANHAIASLKQNYTFLGRRIAEGLGGGAVV